MVSRFTIFRPGQVGGLERVNESGLQAEWSGDRHVAINISVDGSVDRVWEVVRELEDVAVWEWSDVEEFRTGRP
jgi:hypothetical protein